MGRLVGFLADCLALARLVVEGRALWGDWRRNGASPESRGGPAGGRPAEAGPEDPPRGLGPTGPEEGP